MRRKLGVGAVQYTVLPAERLFGDEGEIHRRQLEDDESMVYLISYVRAHRWDPNSSRIGNDFDCVGKVLRAGSTDASMRIDAADFWLSMTNMKEKFGTRENLAIYALSREVGSLRNISKYTKEYKERSRILSLVSGVDISIDCAIKRNMTQDGDGLTPFYIYQMIQQYGAHLSPDIEVVYVGKSQKGAFDRLRRHDRWGEIQARKGDGRDIVLHFLGLEASELQIAGPGEQMVFYKQAPSVSRADAASLMEMALISHLKPVFNTHHIEREISRTKIFADLRRTGYSDLTMELKLDGGMGQVGTKTAGYGGHEVTVPV